MHYTRVLIFLSTILVIGVFGTAAILYARGYRVDRENLELTPSGLLVANSEPNGVQVFINGELKTATDNTINLPPETYDIVLKKDGYIPWEKRIVIEKEIVTQIDAFLPPVAPSLTALTFSGAVNPQISRDRSKIAYAIPATADNAERSGLWVIDFTSLPLGFNRDPRRITDGNLDSGSTKWEWSPDGREILLTTNTGVYLLDANEFTPQSQRVNVATKLNQIELEWEDMEQKLLSSQIGRLHDEIEKIFIESAADIQFSPDGDKILYSAKNEASLPADIILQLPGASTQTQQRDIVEGNKYVYDIKEDRNFKISDPEQPVYWIPNSLNLLMPKNDSIVIIDYDGTNARAVFPGNYNYPHAFPSSTLDRMLILTNFGAEESLSNLYWVSLR